MKKWITLLGSVGILSTLIVSSFNPVGPMHSSQSITVNYELLAVEAGPGPMSSVDSELLAVEPGPGPMSSIDSELLAVEPGPDPMSSVDYSA